VINSVWLTRFIFYYSTPQKGKLTFALSFMKGKKKFFTIVILGMLAAIGPFSIDMYLPGFPEIANDLQTTVGKVSLSLSSFFIGISFGQLFYGPILDRYGRKKPLYFGLSLYVAASIGCAFAVTVEALIFLRLLQALGGCAGMVASRAMTRDLFEPEELAKVFSLLMLVIGVSPIIAPTLGGYVTSHFGWHYVFVILTCMALALLVAIHFMLPETRKADSEFSLLPKNIIKTYAAVFKVPQFYTYALTGSVAAAGLYAYITGSPYVFMNLFGVTEQQYGWIFAFIALCLILSSQLNSLVLRKYTSRQITRAALGCQVLVGITLLMFALTANLNAAITIALVAMFLSCQGFTFPNSSALSLAPFTKNAGSAAALLGGIQMAIGAFTSAIVSVFNNQTPVPMAAAMALCAVTSFGILIYGTRKVEYSSNQQKVDVQAKEMITEM
jgi:MFS transporter, DHA1 family, multidrug resistance protein